MCERGMAEEQIKAAFSVCEIEATTVAPELVLVPLTASVRKFNCLFHSFSVQGARAKGKEGNSEQKREVNKAENTSAV